MSVSVLWIAAALAGESTLHVTRADGALDVADVTRTVARHELEVSRCAARHLPVVSQGTAITLTARRGRAVPATVVIHGDELPAGFQRCVVPKVYLWDFPFALGETRVRVALTAPEPPAPAPAPSGPLAVPVAPPAPQTLLDAVHALRSDGALITLDGDILALLRGEDLCADAPDEFAAARCDAGREARQQAAADALAGGWLYITDLEATLGTWDVDSTRFPLTVDPVLVTGGLNTAAAPTLTAGEPRIRYASDGSGAFSLALPALPALRSVAIPLDDAESLANATQRRVTGSGLVRLRRAYSQSVRTAAWYTAQQDPEGWHARLVRGEARDIDRFVTLYGIDVEPVALEFTDPRTGAVIGRWVAPDAPAAVPRP